ncbi:MAG: ABC transporter ATP-binding protein [Actinomycetota bacterium]
MSVAVDIKNLTFTYRVLRNRTGSIKELFKEFLHGRVRLVDYTALVDMTFHVNSGEVFAIVGRNGAGKSTLLKVIAQVLPPTKGSAIVNGSIAPMIELGAGFHPEMTGAENVIFYSVLMGRDIKTVKARVNEIGEWAGVSDHMDFPLRAFSSGMVARLAFSTATDTRSDVLLIDEILSVGDAEFQEKSRNRMRELMSGGAAAILVTHDMNAVRELAQRAMWIEHGTVKMIGPAAEVAAAYESSGH